MYVYKQIDIHKGFLPKAWFAKEFSQQACFSKACNPKVFGTNSFIPKTFFP